MPWAEGQRSTSTQPPTLLLMAPHLCRMPDGARIGYRVLGGEHAQGPTLVMVNGMSAVMDDWMELAVPLARTRQVVLFDHRGLGASHGTGCLLYTSPSPRD